MKRVITVAGVPPEKCAYALARYSRSPDSIRESLEWVRTQISMRTPGGGVVDTDLVASAEIPALDTVRRTA